MLASVTTFARPARPSRRGGAGPCHIGACLAGIAAPFLLSGCGPAASPGWSGYAEADYVYLAAPVAGTLTALTVAAGDAVAAGDTLFQLDDTSEAAAQGEAQARVAAAQAQADNTTRGRRTDELAVTQAQLDQARAQAARAEIELQRQQALQAQGFIARTRLDDADTSLRQARDRVAELEAALRVARLPARPDEQAAARASADAASQAWHQARWRLGQTRQTAPTAARVADTFFRVGEFVPAGQPVLSLLSDAQRKARFFVPEAVLGALAVGQPVLIQCDGCGAPLHARISRIATQAEYTPPVIYSNAQRSRLVFMVEARPEPTDASRLHPGQPVDVRLAEAAASAPRTAP